jgi:hypothetical protein
MLFAVRTDNETTYIVTTMGFTEKALKTPKPHHHYSYGLIAISLFAYTIISKNDTISLQYLQN